MIYIIGIIGSTIIFTFYVKYMSIIRKSSKGSKTLQKVIKNMFWVGVAAVILATLIIITI